jgi:hypothetical protein
VQQHLAEPIAAGPAPPPRFSDGLTPRGVDDYMWVVVIYQSGYRYQTAVANSPEQYA